MDSLIRLRQLNQSDLTGFVTKTLFRVLQDSGFNLSNGNIVPTLSGVADLGTPELPFGGFYTNSLSLPSGSGINFGPYSLTISESNIYVNGTLYGGGGIQGLSIIGPSGAQGVQGPTGETGAYVTGAEVVSITGLRFQLSNGATTNTFALPSGLQGPTGISITGFSVNGNYLTPQFSDGSMGAAFYVPSGLQGPQGVAGGIYIDLNQMTGVLASQVKPSVTIYNVNPYGTLNPDLNFIKGMSYTIGESGLNLASVTNNGDIPSIPNGTYNTNLFVDENGVTGYMRFTVFKSDVTSVTDTYTGRYVAGETAVSYATINGYVEDDNLFTNLSEPTYKNSLSFIARWSAESAYKYGFARYHLDGTKYSSSDAWGFYVLGNLDVNYFGPQGPAGPQGVPGVPGPQGARGLPGTSAPGNGVVGFNVNNTTSQFQFVYSDGTTSQWVSMPMGGPSGAQGPAGPVGPQGVSLYGFHQAGNYITPVFDNGTQGSSILLPAGPQGLPGDQYYSSYYPNDVQMTGVGNTIYTGFNKQVGGIGSWVLCTGTDRHFAAGDRVWMINPSFVGKAYSANQNLLFTDTGINFRYFYGQVNSFSSSNGEMQFTVSSAPYPPVGLVEGAIRWGDYSQITTNLGGLGSPGPAGSGISVTGFQQSGPTSIIPQFSDGTTGAPVSFTVSTVAQTAFVNNSNNPVSLNESTLTIDPTTYDSWNLSLDGINNIIYFDCSKFPVGKTVIVKVINNTIYDNTSTETVLTWTTLDSTPIRFPFGMEAPIPDHNTCGVYTFVRFPDAIFNTYSLSYTLS